MQTEQRDTSSTPLATPVGQALGHTKASTLGPDGSTVSGLSIQELAARLPPAFVFGSGTSAYQIEGGRTAKSDDPTAGIDRSRNHVWEHWCDLEKVKDPQGRIVTGDDACKHYTKCPEDCDIIDSIGLDSYRFSIAWTRVIKSHEINEADGSVRVTVDPKGMTFYRELMERLVADGVEPMPTLYHWDLPQSLQDAVGGWLSPITATAFAEYARACFQHLGHLARRWTTLNEPYVVAHHGYGVAGSPPGIRGQEHVAAHNLLKAHGKAAVIFHEGFDKVWAEANGRPDERGAIGIVLNCAWREPVDPTSEADCAAAALCVQRRFGWFAEPLRSGRYPDCMRDLLSSAGPDNGPLAFTDAETMLLKGSADFIGLNYYTTKFVAAAPGTRDGFVEVPPSADKGLAVNALGWSIVPSGLGKLLRLAADTFPGVDLWITENGYADSVETTGPGTDAAIADQPRIDYMRAHLEQVADAIDAGVPVRGWFVWSLLDNLEWNFGYGPRFGIVHVDFDSPDRTRTLKASALWYKDLIQEHKMTRPADGHLEKSA
ncbi:beta glucosidase [Pandoravirus inopinatum]|uniref:Beta glucosidase n=1 Tax=Pandoravirus inopinatum TaxID=1605721 RepID=A0A0B5JD41_9VIRU|nr:beta glucosidase [Pandoravirus inopinatum]AJF97602.1 beta glucosidase [Pandoravirus inopinatum]